MSSFFQSKLVSVLSIRSFFLLWISQIISQIALNMITFVLGITVYAKTQSNTSVSLLYMAVGVPALLGAVSGVFVDRFSKKRTLIITSLFRAGLAILLLLLYSNLGASYVLLGLLSLSTQFFLPAEASLIPNYVHSHLLLSANALYVLTFYISLIGGYVIGGPVLALFGETALMTILTFVFILVLGLVFLLPQDEALSKKPLGLNDLSRDIKEVLVFIRRTPHVLFALILLVMSQAVIAILATLGPGFADQILHIKLTDASLVVLAPAAIGLILGTLILGNLGDRYRKRNLIIVGIVLSGLVIALTSMLYWINTALPQHISNQSIMYIAVSAFFLMGFANSMIDISCNTALQQYTSEYLRGRVLGILSSLIAGASILPVLLSGFLADQFGIIGLLFGLGVGLLIVGICSMRKKVIVPEQIRKS